MTDLSIYKELTKQSYSENPKELIGDWGLVLNEPNNKVYQNRKTGEIINSTSGSKSTKDLLNDFLLKLGFSNNSLQKQREKETNDILNRLNSVRKPRDVGLVGHSLGGLVNQNIIKRNEASKAINFNPYIPTRKDIYDDKRILNIRNENDFASTYIKNNRNTINLTNKSDSIKSHFLDEIYL